MPRLIIWLSFCSLLAGAFGTAPALANETDEAFRAITAREWTWRNAEFSGDEDGEDTTARRRLPSVDPATHKARLKVWEGVLAELDALDPEALSDEEKINYAVYRPQVENLAASVRFRDYEMPFNSDSSFWSDLGFMTRRPMRTAADYRGYLAQLDDVPRYFDEQIANMRRGLKRGFSVPRAVLDGRDVSIAAVAELKDPTESTFYQPFRVLPASIPADEQAALRREAAETLGRHVIPAYARLLKFFRGEYLSKARTTLAAEAMPDGRRWYRQQIREYTTLDLDPEAIHAIGLAEVERIEGQMRQTMRDARFEGSFPEFLAFLRSDPQFYAKTPEELLMRAAWIAKRVDGQLGRFFGLLPRGRFTIVPVPADIAPFWTAGRGGATTYWVNTYDLPSRPLYNLPALTLHESAPGHSLQGALANEQTGQPEFRRKNYISAYGEGWALYTEKLGQEMGIYETPYEEFGRQTYEMWRAARLVIDTGVHHKGWSREQALAYLRDRTALSEHEVTTEVDRYISWPAQALSYKLGEIRIVELRAEAERTLGTHFDIRAFHDAVLALGSVPLPVLEREVRRFIAAAKDKADGKDEEKVDVASG
ncbi:DUF885 domain-containing protein [Dokdonella koreensis]|uniref:Uncharacterized protein n=1 Tax=Dokdonella koreensis DS-123 TaxID=1300342 RepID=A0A160DYL9_9GAMM|nr:DUF885 family protein [Dokdonella koreensis]ANB19521.1 Hypothetical protein I596_3533 [Dokdonella koreensis DS-123]